MKRIAFVFLLFMVLMFISSCVTNKGIYPKGSNIPEEQRCILTIKFGVMILAFDDKFVRWNDPLRDPATKPVKVSIEPGVHKMVIQTSEQKREVVSSTTSGNVTTTTYRDTSSVDRDWVEMEFTPGHNYEFSLKKGLAQAVLTGAFRGITGGEYEIAGLQIRNLTTKEWIYRSK